MPCLQTWPPQVVSREGREGQYLTLADGLRVLNDVDDAIRWANALIEEIASA